jgi:cell division septation protein DedD
MRNVFLGLVLANLAFAAWSAWFAPAQSAGRRADDGLPGLTLVSEVPDDLRSSGVAVEPQAGADPAVVSPPPSSAETPSSDAPNDAVSSENAAEASVTDIAVPDGAPEAAGAALEPAASCTSVGPFRELSQAATAAAALRTAGYMPLQRVAEGDIWIGYWVYIQAIATEAEANAILAKMRDAGITDSYVIPNSDTGNLVSLGVFSEISGVSRRRDQVRALGYEPQVVDRTRRATVYWIDVTLAPEQTLDFDALQPPGRIIRLEQRSCERPPA